MLRSWGVPPPDKIRYILIIRVRFTTEFFPNTDLSNWHGCFARWGTVFQTAITICHGNPETSFRVTLASLGIGFQPNLMVVGHLWIKYQYKNKQRKIYLFIFIYWYFFIRSIRIISVRFTTEFFSNAVLSDWHRCFARWGTVFQTAITICHENPETSSRVTLASLGIGFQPNLMVVGHLWIKHQYKKTEKNIFVYFYLLIFFHRRYTW